MDLAHGGTGGLFVVVAGRLSAEEASRLAAGRRDAGPAIALLLAVSTWAGRRPADGEADETDAPAGILRAAGWRVTTITADTPLTTAWERLRASSGLLSLPGHEQGRFQAGAGR
jgi:hypothetical protein